MKAFALFLAMFSAGTAMACQDGQRGSVTVYDSSRDHSYEEPRICRNGSYMNDAERAAYVRNPKKCKDGAVGSMTIYDSARDKTITEVRICRGGTYMNAAEKAAYIRNPNTKCRNEGQLQTWSEPNGFNDHNVAVTVQCQSGRWVEIRRN